MSHVNRTAIKTIISKTQAPEARLFLSVINEHGTITLANAAMIKDLELENPRTVQTNFFDLLHPCNVDDFKRVVQQTSSDTSEAGIEVYIKNGYYHPMKWSVNFLEKQAGAPKTLFCIGYKIVDDERLKQYNEVAEKHYPLIMEALTGITLVNEHGELIAANQQAATLFNTTLERLYQLKNIRKLWESAWEISDEQGQPVSFETTPFMLAAATGKPQQASLKIKMLNGSEISDTF